MSPIVKALKDNRSYLVTSIVLSKEEPFTLDQIHSELLEKGFKDNGYSVSRKLNQLRDRGILLEQGSYYYLVV